MSEKFNIQIIKGDDELFLASALGFTGGGNTVKGALDAWIEAIIDDALGRVIEAQRIKAQRRLVAARRRATSGQFLITGKEGN